MQDERKVKYIPGYGTIPNVPRKDEVEVGQGSCLECPNVTGPQERCDRCCILFKGKGGKR